MLSVRIFGDGDALRFEDLALSVGGDSSLGEVESNRSRPLATARLQNGLHASSGAEQFVFSASTTKLEVEAVNRQNPGIVGVENDDDDEDGSILTDGFPWSYKGANSALVYRFVGESDSGLETGAIPLAWGISGAFSFESGSRLEMSHVRVHPDSELVSRAFSADIGNGSGFKFPLDSAHLSSLNPEREYLMTEFQAGFGFAAEFTWGQVFRANRSLVRAVFPKSAPTGSVLHAAGGNEPFEAEVIPTVRVRTVCSSRLRLIAWRKDSDTVRLEFYNATSATKSASGGVRIRASLLSPTEAKAAASALISRALPKSAIPFAELSRRIGELESRIDSWRKALDFSEIADEGKRAIVERICGALNVSLADIGLLDQRRSLVTGAFAKVAGTLGISSDGMPEIGEKIESAIAQISLSNLPVPHAASLAKISRALNVVEASPLVLSEMLGTPNFVEKVTRSGLGVTGENIDALRTELYRLADSIDVGEIEHRVLSSVVENTGLPISQVLAGIDTDRALKAASSVSEDALDGALKQVGDVISNGWKGQVDSGLELIAEKVARRFAIKEREIPAFFSRITDLLGNALTGEAELSASFEISRKKENESLFSFDFAAADDETAWAKLRDIYDGLLRGNLEFALNEHREGSHSSCFENTDFLLAENVNKRGSFALQLLFFQSKKFAKSRRKILTDIDGKKDHTYAECVAVEGEYRKKRFWKTYFDLAAGTDRFLPADSIRAEDFRQKLELSSSWKGSANRKVARNGFNFILDALYQSGKFDFSKTEIARYLDEAAGEEALVELKYHIVIDHAVFTGILQGNVIDQLESSFAQGWRKAKKGPWKIFNSVYGESDDSVSKTVFRRLRKLSKAYHDNESPDAYGKRMKLFRKGYAEAWGKAHSHLFKFCFPYALLMCIPAKLPGWHVTASLTKGDEQIFLA